MEIRLDNIDNTRISKAVYYDALISKNEAGNCVVVETANPVILNALESLTSKGIPVSRETLADRMALAIHHSGYSLESLAKKLYEEITSKGFVVNADYQMYSPQFAHVVSV